MNRILRWTAAIFVLLFVFAGVFLKRDSLWLVVHDLCGPMDSLTGVPIPCLAVNRERGFATLRPSLKKTGLIVTPLHRVSGVESPALQQADTPNYWLDAWSQRDLVTKTTPRSLKWSEIGMAINSPQCRSQDQLHIHVDCLDPRLKQTLSETGKDQEGWFDLDLQWARIYRARRVKVSELQNIFRMVAQELSGKDELAPEAFAAVIAEESIAVVGWDEVNGEKDFVVLLTRGEGGCAEELLDRQCRLAN